MSNINAALDYADIPNIHTFLNQGDKMDLCGSVPQTKEIRFKAHDNRKRENAVVKALMHIGQEERYLSVIETDPFVYEFGFSHNERGVAILEIFINEVQIPDSPIRVEVTSRDCNDDFPGKLMVPVSNLHLV